MSSLGDVCTKTPSGAHYRPINYTVQPSVSLYHWRGKESPVFDFLTGIGLIRVTEWKEPGECRSWLLGQRYIDIDNQLRIMLLDPTPFGSVVLFQLFSFFFPSLLLIRVTLRIASGDP